ncbi:MAG: PilZ domain-containing protein [Planctomycetota bacterium]
MSQSPEPDRGPERHKPTGPPHAGGPEASPEVGRKATGAERRRHQRARADWPITIVLDDGVHQAKIRDVSRGGVSFFLDRPIPEMTALRVQFDIPVEDGVRKIQGVGAVVRCERIARNLEHYEIAVFVQDMALPDRETVDGYVRRTSDF